MVQPLDLWTLFVVNIFGNFWLAVIGLLLLIFIIMGVLGRISIYTTTWYMTMFVFSMALGYGYVLLNVIIFAVLLIAFMFSWRNYFS
jgi:hypothetical protein